jgi:hypothetical protein
VIAPILAFARAGCEGDVTEALSRFRGRTPNRRLDNRQIDQRR